MKKQCMLCVIPNCSLNEDVPVSECPLHKGISRIGKKWTLIVLAVLHKQPMRFGQLKKTITDITEKVLIHTLRHLEDAGYIAKEKSTGKQLRSTYSIRPEGKNIIDVAIQIAEIGKI